jgi:hypothetical protein
LSSSVLLVKGATVGPSKPNVRISVWGAIRLEPAFPLVKAAGRGLIDDFIFPASFGSLISAQMVTKDPLETLLCLGPRLERGAKVCWTSSNPTCCETLSMCCRYKYRPWLHNVKYGLHHLMRKAHCQMVTCFVSYIVFLMLLLATRTCPNCLAPAVVYFVAVCGCHMLTDVGSWTT